MKNIKRIRIVTAQDYGQSFWIGQTIPVDGVKNESIIDEIQLSSLLINGDPYDHYLGFDKSGNMLFSVNALIPCEVIYENEEKKNV